jgi:hypothetical protein
MRKDSLAEGSRPTRYPNSVPGSIPARIYTAGAVRGALALARGVVVCVQKHMTLQHGA